MKILEQLFSILGDGRFHSGELLSQQLQVSRSSVWNGVEKLKAMGLEIYAVKGQGYKLAEPVEPLNKERILQAITPEAKLHLPHLDVHWSLDSTNQYLMELAKYGAQSGHACLAEIQTAGRGRRGRAWVSPFGGNVYLSQMWRFQAGPALLGGLSLATAVAVARALRKTGVQGFALKWPNDIVANGKKLAGILLEISGEAAGPATVVCGIGINMLLNTESARDIDQPWTDLYHLTGVVPPRNRLVGTLLSELITMYTEFEANGLQPFLPEWQQLDAYDGKPVELSMHDNVIQGIARGVDPQGALKLEVGGTLRAFHSGEISLRPA
jgi:BirA family biotin operon repressor/biotin-[acetyl-CoA-carboxylase] ligase